MPPATGGSLRPGPHRSLQPPRAASSHTINVIRFIIIITTIIIIIVIIIIIIIIIIISTIIVIAVVHRNLRVLQPHTPSTSSY
jgi:hypothetical protein